MQTRKKVGSIASCAPPNEKKPAFYFFPNKDTRLLPLSLQSQSISMTNEELSLLCFLLQGRDNQDIEDGDCKRHALLKYYE